MPCNAVTCNTANELYDEDDIIPLRGLLGAGSSSSSSLLLSESESKSMAAIDAADAMAEGLRPAGAIDFWVCTSFALDLLHPEGSSCMRL